MPNEQPKELGWLAEGAAVYIIIFWVISLRRRS